MYCLETSRAAQDFRCCNICNRIIEETKYFITIDGYRTKYYHHKCYKYILERLFGNF